MAKTLRPNATIFRKTDSEIPELPNSLTSGQSNGPTEKVPRIKATFHLSKEDVIAIDIMQLEEFKQRGKKPERSEVVSRAIQELYKRQSA